jgi:hypothetical protein
MSQQKVHHRSVLWMVALCLLVTILFIAGSLAAAPQAQQRIYLPAIMDNFQGAGGGAKGISGKVTDGGKAAADIKLDLRRYDNNGEVTVKSTTTDAKGAYLFSGVPSLGAGQTYYVRFGPNDDNEKQLYFWFGPDITSYVSGTAVSGSDFDISDVVLLKPTPGATVSLPITFQWQRRGVAGDDYVVEILDLTGGDTWVTNNLGDVGSFTASNLPPEIVAGKTYGWDMIVFHGDDAFGYSYWYHEIIFSSTTLQQQPDGGGKVQWQHSGTRGKGRTTMAHER